MKKIVDMRNNTASTFEFDGRSVPAMGALHMSYPSYFESLKGTSEKLEGVSVSMRDVMSRSVSVKDFGAKGDGFSDDTYQIQSAIDYMVDNGGGVVNVPIGVYSVTSLTVYGNVSVVGESRSDSVIRSIGEVGALITLSGSECGLSDITVAAV